MIGQFSGPCFAVRPAKLKSLFTPPPPFPLSLSPSLSLFELRDMLNILLTSRPWFVLQVTESLVFSSDLHQKNCIILLVTKSCLYRSVLHLISWEAAASFLYQWQEKAKQAQSFTGILFNSWFKIAKLFVCSSDSILTRTSQEIIRMMMSSSM